MNFHLPTALASKGTDTVVGAALGKSASTVNRWRTEKGVPSPDDQVPLSKYLGVPVEDVAAWCAKKADALRGGM